MDKIERFNKQFKKELERLLNSHSIENECDVPDFLLAEMIIGFIQAIGLPIKKTLDWHGCDSICHPRHNKTLQPTRGKPGRSSNYVVIWRRNEN